MTTRSAMILAVFLTLFSLGTAAQQPLGRFRSLDELLESMTDEMEEGEEFSSWLEEMQQLRENPININTAGKEELLRIPFIHEISAAAIVEYRDKTGPFFTVYELASVPAIGKELAEKISFFIVTGESTPPPAYDTLYKKRSYHDLLLRGWRTFPNPAGYRSDGEKPPAYPGSPEKLYVRYRVEIPGSLEAGFTADKDPGEPLFRSPNKAGFDFLSFHAAIRVNQRIPLLAIGDFTARTGQGLVLWQGFSMGRSSDVMLASKNMSQIRPYTSSDENRFFRGVGVTFKGENSSLNLMISSKKSDGNLVLGEDSTLQFSSLQTSGYHRTGSEAEDKKSVRHSVAAVFYTVTAPHLKAGVTALAEMFQYPLVPGHQLYEKFLFAGTKNYNLGIDYRWVTGNFQIYGEGAVSRSGGIAAIQGMEARLHDQLNLSFLFRHFDRDYHATWASAFASNDKANNETGLYAGLKIFPASRVTLSAFADWSKFPWLLYTTSGPSSATEWMVRTDVRLSHRLSGYIRVKSRTKGSKIHEGNLYLNGTGTRENLRIHGDYVLSDKLTLRSRAEWSRVTSPSEETGFMLSQDLAWTPQHHPFASVMRIAWFNTGSYDTRIYAFENDLLYAFSSSSFFGKGIRTYINVRGSLSSQLDFWFKVAHTTWFDRETISSGYAEVEGRSKTEVKIQFRWRF